jgi:hypothetical protein
MKSSTDLHWNERAARIENDIEVNIMDIFQRELEYDYVCRYLTKEMKVLEGRLRQRFLNRTLSPAGQTYRRL